MFGKSTLDSVGDEGSDAGTSARQHANDEADDRAVGEGKAAGFQLFPAGKQISKTLGDRKYLRLFVLRDAVQHFRDREDADGDDHEIETAEKRRLSEGEARLRGEEVGADGGQPQADKQGDQTLDQGIPRQQHDEREAQCHQREIFRRREGQREFRHGRRNEAQRDDAEGAGDEGRNRGNAQSCPGATLARHLVAIQTGHDR